MANRVGSVVAVPSRSDLAKCASLARRHCVVALQRIDTEGRLDALTAACDEMLAGMVGEDMQTPVQGSLEARYVSLLDLLDSADPREPWELQRVIGLLEQFVVDASE